MIRVSVPKLDLLYWLLAFARAPLPLDLLNVLEKLEAKHWLLKGAGAFSGRERESCHGWRHVHVFRWWMLLMEMHLALYWSGVWHDAVAAAFARPQMEPVQRMWWVLAALRCQTKKTICCAWPCGLMRKRMAQPPFAQSNYCFSILASVISYKCWLELFCYGSPAALGKQVTMVCLLVALVLH